MTHDGRRFKLRLSRTKRKVDRRRQILAFLGASRSVEISTSIDDYKRLSLAAGAAVAAAAAIAHADYAVRGSAALRGASRHEQKRT